MASNSIQIAPSSSSSSCSTQWINEVFLSFRGETCNSFTDHLYHTLIEKEKIENSALISLARALLVIIENFWTNH